MAQLRRIARSRAVPGVGYARRGVIHTVPDEMEKDLLATGEWEKVGKETTRERVTEPAPSEPAASAQASKPKAKSKKK